MFLVSINISHFIIFFLHYFNIILIMIIKCAKSMGRGVFIDTCTLCLSVLCSFTTISGEFQYIVSLKTKGFPHLQNKTPIPPEARSAP